jgi:tetratricopeptide (TPR) repeat protein
VSVIRAVAAALALALAGCGRPALSVPGADATHATHAGQSVEELEERGQAFAAIGDPTRAEQYLSAALDKGADVRRVLPVLVRVCIESGRYRAASEHLRAYLLNDPDNPKLHVLYGLLEASVGDRSVALREYAAALRTQPDDPAVHYALAILLRDGVGDAGGADAQFREYLRLVPQGEHAAEARASLLGGEAP